jgi:hypothetical protein
MTVKQLLANTSSAELTEWMIYETIEPFTDHRASAQAAMIAMVIANSKRKKGAPAYTIEDFVVKFEPKSQAVQQSWQEQMQIMKSLFPVDKPKRTPRKRKQSTANDT